MLKKAGVSGTLVIAAAAAGTMLTGTTATAQPMGGWGHFRQHFRASSRSSNWNGNDNFTGNRIRIRINNRNNNVAVARNEQAQRDRQRPSQRRWVTAAECRAGGGSVIFQPGLGTFCAGGIFGGWDVRG